jgi:hypothetical protein
MDNQTVLLICSLIFNIGLMVERTFKRVKKSECCGGKLEMSSDSPSNNEEQKATEMKQISVNV